MEGTASLRTAAPQWSLAGDKQLLDILQNIHQSLVTRCQEVNRKLDEMVLALDGASVDLQNVNNKFMALSNSQFIESRVYDDDVDVATQQTQKDEVDSTQPASDLEQLKTSIRVLEQSHELIEILDSDSESDDDEVTRTVLKAKDRYAHRPLPYIIGSQAWRNKWHAGLHPEDSDSDSVSCKSEGEQYSASDPEPEVPREAPSYDREESTGSSELVSEQDVGVGVGPQPSAGRAPADIAAELARRLGGDVAKIPLEEPDYSLPNPVKKVFRPDQPSAGNLFWSEPPPLDQHGAPSEDEETDDDIFSSVREKAASTPIAKKPVFEEESEPELFSSLPPTKTRQEEQGKQQDFVKKPVGGISLFGNNQHGDSIGAAILKRNQRGRSSSDESDYPPPIDDTPPKHKEKDIFDDLFAKSEREQKKTAQKKEKKEVKEVKAAKVDLFSDNIFDDIDDIFANVTVVSKKEKKDDKPLFDDDDDIFADIVPKDSKADAKSGSSKKKSIFDSDDDLFADVKKTDNVKPDSSKSNRNTFGNVDDIFSDIVEAKVPEKSAGNVVNETVSDSRKRFDESGDSGKQRNNNDIVNNKQTSFSTINKVSNQKEIKVSNNNVEKSTKSLFEDEDDDELFAKKPSSSDENSNVVKNVANSSNVKQMSSIFDDESDDSDLFGSSKKANQTSKDTNVKSNVTSTKNETKEEISINTKANPTNIKTTSIFDDEMEDDDIFSTVSKKPNIETNKISKTEPKLFENKSEIKIESKNEIINPSKSIFDDDDSDDSNLFETKSKIVNKPETKQKEIDKNEQTKTKIESKDSIKEETQIFQDEPKVKEQSASTDNKKPEVVSQKPALQQKPTVKPSSLPEMVNEVTQEVPNAEKLMTDSTAAKNEELVNKNNNFEDTIETEVPTDNKTKDEIKPNTTEEKLTTKQDIKQTKIDLNDSEIASETPVPKSETKTETGNVIEEKDTLFSEPKDSLLNTPPVFDDLFSEPPAFEKSAEPKKSKNINALFDDDSDDEALFFKKNDATLDEKPDVSGDSNNALFGIFHDEPPAMDVDFIQKTAKSNIDDLLKSDSDDDFLKNISENKNSKSKKELSTDSSIEMPKKEEDIFKKPTAIEKTTKPTPVLDKAEKIEQKLKSEQKNPNDTPDTEVKKVGKLKTMNFNIDVSTLLPGASPKKNKTVEQTDGQSVSIKTENILKEYTPKQTDIQSLSTKSSEDLHSKEKVEPSVVKSISFEGEPDPNILDNKLSKERAKIQVKRRPSTRRARKEAVRKSAIDIADDSTDNSSSFDEPPKPRSQSRTRPDLPKPHKVEKTEPTTESEKDLDSLPSEIEQAPKKAEIIANETEETKVIEHESTKIEETVTKIDLEKPKLEIESRISPSTSLQDSVDVTDSIPDKEVITGEIQSNVTSISNEKHQTTQKDELFDTQTQKSEVKNVTSKIVYILNDEDIFTNPSIENAQKPKVLNIVDDDDLFKVNNKKTVDSIGGISTLGNAYKDIATDIEREVKSHLESVSKDDSRNIRSQKSIFDKPSQSKLDINSKITNVKKEDKKKSLFDDLSDDDNELFTKNKKVAPKTKSILDSDSEDDLFGGGRKKEKKDESVFSAKETKDVKPKVEVKSSLFGDDDDDDDLFGVKVKSQVAASPLPSRASREVTPKPPEPVFDDPLSLLGGDDD